jgi:hypothetical protein
MLCKEIYLFNYYIKYKGCYQMSANKKDTDSSSSITHIIFVLFGISVVGGGLFVALFSIGTGVSVFSSGLDSLRNSLDLLAYTGLFLIGVISTVFGLLIIRIATAVRSKMEHPTGYLILVIFLIVLAWLLNIWAILEGKSSYLISFP